MDDFAELIRSRLQIPETDPRLLSPLTLAFVGDAVFDLIIRTEVAAGAQRAPDKLNRDKVKRVNAAAQAALVEAMLPHLTEEESDIFRRGRNAKPHTTAKHQRISDYHKATGLEALAGYLFLKGESDRLLTLLALAKETE